MSSVLKIQRQKWTGGIYPPPSAAGIRVNKEKLQKHRHRRILPTVQSLHTTTFRILYPRLVAISEERYWMPWTCAKEGCKTGRIMKKKPYAERLKAMQLTTLEKRRLRGDLVETYEIVTNKENIDSAQFFGFTDTGHDLKGHTLKLSQSRNISRVRRMFFSQRVVSDWNRLPQ